MKIVFLPPAVPPTPFQPITNIHSFAGKALIITFIQLHSTLIIIRLAHLDSPQFQAEVLTFKIMPCSHTASIFFIFDFATTILITQSQCL